MLACGTQVTDLSSELEGTVNKALEETSADVKANTKFIEFAQDCAANGQGVTIDKDKKLVCADTNPTAAADAECDDANEGRVSIRAAEIGGLKLPASFVCYNKVWVSFSKQLSADAKALGLSQNTAATSCNQIKAIKPTSPNGLYWVEQNGDNGAKIQVMCIMDDKYDGGGWQLLLTLTHHQNMFHGSKHPLGFGNVNGDTPSLNNAYAKNWVDINQPAKGDDFLLINSGNLWKRMVMTFDFCGWDSTDNGVCTGGHGTYAKGQIYNEDGSKVPCGNAGCWSVQSLLNLTKLVT